MALTLEIARDDLFKWVCDEPSCDAEDTSVGFNRPPGWVRARVRPQSKGFDVRDLWTVYCPKHRVSARRD